MVNEKRFNDWYKHSSDAEIKKQLKKMSNRGFWAVGIALALFILLFASIGYYETELYIKHGVLMQSAKMNLFMAGAIGYCANQSNTTTKEVILDYSKTYIGMILDNNDNQTNEDCKYGCDNLITTNARLTNEGSL